MAQRIRTRNQGSLSTLLRAARPLGGDNVVPRNYAGRYSRVEICIDDPDWKQRAFKPCAHSQVLDTMVYEPQLHLLEQDLYLGMTTQWREGNLATHICNQFTTTGVLDFTWQTLATVSPATIKELFLGCLPSLNDGNSAVNFLLELKDVRTLVRTASNMRRYISRLKNSVASLKRNGFRKDTKPRTAETLPVATGRALADAHLSYSFGIAPFITDVKRFYHTLKTLNERIAWLEANHDKVLIRRNRIKLGNTNFVGGTEQHYPGNMGAYYSGTWGAGTVDFRITRRWIVPPTLYGTLKYRYALTSTVPLKDQISTYLSAFGVEKNPKIVWDAIPFSFLVDWVVDVGEFLESFKIDALGIRTEVIDYCYTIKWHATADCWVSEYNPYRQKPTPHILVRQVDRIRYERKVGIPSLNAVDVSGLGSREFLLGGSLALTAGSRPTYLSRRGNPMKKKK